MKIELKLFLGFLTVALLFGIFGWIDIEISQKALIAAIGDRSAELARETVDAIDRYIYNKTEGFQDDFSSKTSQEILVESNKKFENLPDIQSYIAAKDKEWVTTPKEEITPFMREIIGCEGSKRLMAKMEFYKKKYGYNVFGEMFITNKYGANVAQTGKTSDYYQADEPWWTAAKQDGIYVQDVEYDGSSGIYSVALCMRIDDGQGAFLGVMKAVLNIDGAFDIVRELGREGNREYAKLKNPQYATNVRADYKLFTRNGNVIYSKIKSEDSSPGAFNQTPVHWVISKSEKILPQDSDGFFIGRSDLSGENEDALFAYAYSKGYKNFKGLGWLFVIEYKTDEIFAPVTKLKNFLFIVSLAIAALGLSAGFLVSRSIVRPIALLKTAMAKITKGDFNVTIPRASSDEIGELADSFNKMAQDLKIANEQLRSYAVGLEEKIKLRTRELEEAKGNLEITVETKTKELQMKYQDLNKSQTAMLYMIEDLNRQSKEIRDAQDRVVRTEKLAAIGQLASSVAHELRNPLGVMKNVVYYLKLLELDKINPEIQENLDTLSQEISNSDQIIGDLLEFSRIKKPTLRPENINTIVKEMLPRLEIRPEIIVATELDETLLEIAVDALQMQQIFYNLTNNALQAMEKGGRLTIRTQKNGDCVDISFIDTGSGISEENLKKIFTPLFSTKVKGTGLGLSVCRSLVEGHGGKIEVTSEVGRGATFVVKLPVK